VHVQAGTTLVKNVHLMLPIRQNVTGVEPRRSEISQPRSGIGDPWRTSGCSWAPGPNSTSGLPHQGKADLDAGEPDQYSPSFVTQGRAKHGGQLHWEEGLGEEVPRVYGSGILLSLILSSHVEERG
jgi:hypothetical protein